jgi:hypothetical protein
MSDIPINLTGSLTPDEQYLWDATGTPSPVTRAIEAALGTQRYSGKALTVTESHVFGRSGPLVTLAAALLLAASVAVYFAIRPSRDYAGWTVAKATGKPQIAPIQGKSTAPIGAKVATDATSSAQLQFKQGPRVDLRESTEATVTGEPSVSLASGHLDVQVPQNAGACKVETPAIACTLAPGSTASIQTGDSDSQILVKVGWAEVASGDEHLRLADNYGCSANPKSADIWPPYRVKDAKAAAFTKQIDDLLHSQGKRDEKTQYMILSKALEQAQPADAVLLWNLLPRVDEMQRSAVRNRLAKIVKNPPKGEAFDAVLKLDKNAMDAWWNAVIGR